MLIELPFYGIKFALVFNLIKATFRGRVKVDTVECRKYAPCLLSKLVVLRLFFTRQIFVHGAEFFFVCELSSSKKICSAHKQPLLLRGPSKDAYFGISQV